MANYDLIIIGAGPGGYVAAEEAARLGKKTAVIERKAIGGTCLNVGCIPSKSYLQHSHWIHSIEKANEFGITSHIEDINFSRLVERKDQVVSTLQMGIYSTFKKLGIDYIEGEATWVKDRTFLVDGREFSGKDVILAMGSYPFIPPIPGIKNVDYLTTDEFFSVKKLPNNLAIIGGGVIAVEIAFAMKPLGINVDLIEVAPEILLTEEKNVRNLMRNKLQGMGVKIHEGVTIKEIKERHIELEEQEDIYWDQLLVATGRKPNTKMAIEMGLELTQKGFIKVDSFYETSRAHIYAIGDLIETYMLAHVASMEGIKAVHAICRKPDEPLDSLTVPRSIYTHPEIASFGLSEEMAKERGYDVIVHQLPYSYNGRAIASAETEGFVKIVSEKNHNEILGAVIVGEHATDLLQQLILLRQAEGTLDQVVETIFAHPTISELTQEVARKILST
ncbi:TPA: dihydrolipoyl dehydrogenase [Streptococcus suis]